MGKIRKGVLGGFSGKVGTVIGSSWNGISYMRSLPQHFNDARTPRQLQQRAKFNKAMEFLTPIKDYIRIGYKIYAVKKSAFNAAVSYVVKNAVGGSYPDVEINYPRVLVSRGDLTPPKDVAATISEHCVTITWTDNSAEGSADASDLSMPYIMFQKTRRCLKLQPPQGRANQSLYPFPPTGLATPFIYILASSPRMEWKLRIRFMLGVR